MTDLAFGADYARRGEKSGTIKCHVCDHNQEGFCHLKKKWCSAVRRHCGVTPKGWKDPYAQFEGRVYS